MLGMILLTIGLAGGDEPGRPPTEPAAIARRADEIRQPEAMRKWERIPWMTDLSAALRVAREEHRPLLIWASGDDPLERC